MGGRGIDDEQVELPSDRMVVRTACIAPFSVLRSAGIARAVTPSALISSMAPWSGLRLATANATPSAPSASAMDRPIPVEPPVISAVLPRRSLSNSAALPAAESTIFTSGTPQVIQQSAKKPMPTSRAIPTEADVLGYFDTLSNEGRWGRDDERGTLNFISPEKRLSALQSVREGMAVSCATLIGGQGAAPDVPYPPLHFMIRSGESVNPERPGAVDFVGLVFHSHVVTHIDALSHSIWRGRIYNGRDAAVVTTEQGATELSIDALREGIITRGVLLDIAGLAGKDWLDAGDAVLPSMLEEAEKAQGVRVEEGDALLVRTGWWERRLAEGPHSEPLLRPGLHAACLPWLRDRQVAVVAADAANDVVPSGYAAVEQPIHEVGSVAMGLCLVDVCSFSELRTACLDRGRWSFLFLIAPLRIRYGTGSPVTPLAVF